MDFLRCFLIVLGFLLPLQGWANFGDSSTVKAELIQEEQTVQPGRPFWVAVRLTIEKDWHVYWKNPGDTGAPLTIDWQLPEGFEAGPLQWPYPEKFTSSDIVGFGYENSVVLLSLVTPPKNLQEERVQTLAAQIDWLVCSDLSCQPGSASVKSDIKVSAEAPQSRPELVDLFNQVSSQLPSSKLTIVSKRKNGIIQLEVPKESNETDKNSLVSAYFFPEEQEIIDNTTEPTISSTDDLTNSWIVSLKGTVGAGVSGQTLKGVLVLNKKDGNVNRVEVLDVNTKIQEEKGGDLVGWLDGVATKKTIDEGDSVVQKNSFEFEGGVALALLFAFVGGMILNLMPCVLPVISLKIMSFVKMSGQSRSLTLKHGLWFCFGVMFSFWILAASILVLRNYGQSVGWGFQLQEPIFVVVLASIMFVFALSLFGVFEWGLIFASWAGQKQADSTQKSPGFAASFFSGILATAVATPCTGPFLGSAVGFALTLPAYQAMLIFTSLGLGMCFPYLMLAAFPSCLRFMPKPGAWMETFKQLMGFVLLASVVWLLWVFSAQTNSFSVVCLIAGFLCFAIGTWVYGRGGVPSAGKTKRLLAYAVLAISFFVGIQVMLLPRSSWSHQDEIASVGGDWEVFSPERVAELRAQGTPVLVDFTAKWCLICQANHFVLDSANVKKELADAGVVKFKADWTKNDPVITEELRKFGRNSVPLYVYYGAGTENEPVILPQVLTPDLVTSQVKA